LAWSDRDGLWLGLRHRPDAVRGWRLGGGQLIAGQGARDDRAPVFSSQRIFSKDIGARSTYLAILSRAICAVAYTRVTDAI